MSFMGDLEQLFDKYHTSDQLYQEVCSLQLQLASVQQTAGKHSDDVTLGQKMPQLPGFLVKTFSSTYAANPVCGEICMDRLLAIAEAKQVPDGSADHSSCILSTEQRIHLDTVESLFKVIKYQQPDKWPMVVGCLIKESLPLEMMWQLHDSDILSLQSFLDSALRDDDKCQKLTEQLVNLCSYQGNQADVCQQMLSAFTSHLLVLGFPVKKAEDIMLKKAAMGVLDRVTKGLLDDHMSKEKLLWPTDILHWETDVPPICFKKFCTHTVSLIMSYCPNMKVSEALKRQSEWKSGKIPQHLKTLFKQLLVPFENGEVLEMLRRILEKQEANWQMLLSCLAMFLVCFPQASASIQEHVRRLLAESLENGDMENTIVGFLMARQSCAEGTHVFPTYQQWFQDVFGDSGTSPAGTKKSFTFLMKFLTELVPFEPAHVLKVHILKPPFVPARCRDLLTDYIFLAKTRLADLKVPLEESGAVIYSNQNQRNSESDPGVQDVEKSLAGFESTGKLPRALMEASIFRKPYFVGKFLPALLHPRHLPDVPDTRMKFIDSLKRAGKIPVSLYTKYEEACKRETKLLLEGVFEAEDEDGVDDMLLEPMEQLVHRLKQLTETISAQSLHHRVSELISIISEKIENLTATPDEGKSVTGSQEQGYCALDLCQPSLNPSHVQVVDEVLNCICRTLYAAGGSSLQAWLQQLVRMLGQHTVLLPALFACLLQLATNKDLSEHHIDGLAAFILQVSFEQKQQQFPSLSSKDHDVVAPAETFIELLLQCLSSRNEVEMRHTFRFLTAFLKLVFLHDNFSASNGHDFLPCQLTIMFCLHIWHLIPDLQPRPGIKFSDLQARQESSAKDTRIQHDTDRDTDERLAKILYTSEKFQGLLTAQKPSFEDWIDFELKVDPTQDCLSPLDRSNLLLTLISYYTNSDIGETTQGTQSRHCCSVLMEKIAKVLSRVKTKVPKCPRCGQCPTDFLRTVESNAHSASILLTTLSQLMHAVSVDTQASSSVPWLLEQVFRLTKSSQSGGNVAPEAVIRIVLSLPAYLLYTDCLGQCPAQSGVQSVVRFIEEILVPHLPAECFLPFDITLHILQGCFMVGEWSQNFSDLTPVEKHPVVLLSSLVHWPGLCVMLPASWIAKSPRNSFSALLNYVNSFLTEVVASSPPAVQDVSFCLAAVTFSVLAKRQWNVDLKLLKQLMLHLHEADPQVVVSLSEILLASLSAPEICHQALPPKMDLKLKLLSETWQQWPQLVQSVGQQLTSRTSVSGVLVCADREPYRELAVMRCLSMLPAQMAASGKGLVETIVRMHLNLCHHFQGPPSSGQVADVNIMLELSKFLYQLVKAAPLGVIQSLDPESLKECGLEIFRLQQQRLRNCV